mgnify:CR=1 FL=1
MRARCEVARDRASRAPAANACNYPNGRGPAASARPTATGGVLMRGVAGGNGAPAHTHAACRESGARARQGASSLVHSC